MVINKSALTMGSLAFALLFGGGVYLFMNFGNIAKTVTQRIASETLGVPVTIQSINLSLKDKTVSAHGLRIANPQGFKNPHALTVDDISVTLGNADQKLVVFEDISVGGTQVFVEVQEDGTNLHAIQKRMEQRMAAAQETVNAVTGGNSQPAEPASQDPTEQVKVIIKRMGMGETKMHPSTTLVGDLDLGTITVPAITLTGIGEKENGVLANEAIAQIWEDISSRFNKAAAQNGVLQGLSTDKLKDMGVSQVQGLRGKIENKIDNALGENANQIKDGIRGIFGN